jgi:hypothetical protein
LINSSRDPDVSDRFLRVKLAGSNAYECSDVVRVVVRVGIALCKWDAMGKKLDLLKTETKSVRVVLCYLLMLRRRGEPVTTT